MPVVGGFAYLCAVIDWHSRCVLAWELSNTLDASFCVQAVQRALAVHGVPEIFNTDQGCQFTSAEFTQPLTMAGGFFGLSTSLCLYWQRNHHPPS